MKIAFGPYRDKTVDSDDDAYFLGQMDAEGYSGNYGVFKHTSHESESFTRDWIKRYLRENGVDGAITEHRKSESRGISLEWCNKSFKQELLEKEFVATPSAMKGYLQGIFDGDGCFTNDGKVVLVQKNIERLRMIQQWLLLFGIKASLYVVPAQPKHKRPNPIGRLQLSGASVTHYCEAIGFRNPDKSTKAGEFGKTTRIQGRMWWDRIASVVPADTSCEFVGLKTQTETYISDGFYSHNSGKTTAAVAEVASAALGIPLTGPDDLELPHRYPTDRPLLIWLIGYDEKHLSRLYKKFFAPGLFRIIRDKETKLWRAWKPWLPDDLARSDETKPAPPLIPGGPSCHKNGMIAEWGWDNKSTRVFTVCRLKNGTEIHAHSSGSEAGQGEAVDVIFVDEDIKISSHIYEWQARLADNRGRLIWAAWPHGKNEALRLMSRRADEQRDREKPNVSELVLTFSGNPYIPKEEKDRLVEGWNAAGRAVALSRDLGIFTDDNQLVFPNFNIDLHGVPRTSGPDALEDALRQNGGQIPRDWTRYLGIDPGHAHAAAVMVAVPPPALGRYFLIYDEVYTERCNPDIQAELIAAKSCGVTYQAFIIDAHAGRQTTLAYGKRVVELYREAFEKHKLRSRLTESGFLPGSDDIGSRNQIVRDWMQTRPDGTTQFRIVSDMTPHLRREFTLYRKQVLQDDVTDKVRHRDNHLCDAMAYVAAYLAPMFDYGEAYVPESPVATTSVMEWCRKLMGQRKSDDSVYLGAGAVPNKPQLVA